MNEFRGHFEHTSCSWYYSNPDGNTQETERQTSEWFKTDNSVGYGDPPEGSNVITYEEAKQLWISLCNQFENIS